MEESRGDGTKQNEVWLDDKTSLPPPIWSRKEKRRMAKGESVKSVMEARRKKQAERLDKLFSKPTPRPLTERKKRPAIDYLILLALFILAVFLLIHYG